MVEFDRTDVGVNLVQNMFSLSEEGFSGFGVLERKIKSRNNAGVLAFCGLLNLSPERQATTPSLYSGVELKTFVVSVSPPAT